MSADTIVIRTDKRTGNTSPYPLNEAVGRIVGRIVGAPESEIRGRLLSWQTVATRDAWYQVECARCSPLLPMWWSLTGPPAAHTFGCPLDTTQVAR